MCLACPGVHGWIPGAREDWLEARPEGQEGQQGRALQATIRTWVFLCMPKGSHKSVLSRGGHDLTFILLTEHNPGDRMRWQRLLYPAGDTWWRGAHRPRLPWQMLIAHSALQPYSPLHASLVSALHNPRPGALRPIPCPQPLGSQPRALACYHFSFPVNQEAGSGQVLAPGYLVQILST